MVYNFSCSDLWDSINEDNSLEFAASSLLNILMGFENNKLAPLQFLFSF